MKALYKPALIKLMISREETIKRLKNEFLYNESNDPGNLDLFLQQAYHDIEPVYTDIMTRYSKPLEITILSKMNSDSEVFKEPTYRWDIP